MKAIAILSMLHEGAATNSATRQFRGEPVLGWTLRRLCRATRLAACRVLCWDDQFAAVKATGATAESIGPRVASPQIDSIAAARRWSDGWRGGPLGSTEFDLGFCAAQCNRLATQYDSSTVLIDPAAGLIDARLIDCLVEHASQKPSFEHAFLPAPPGFTAMLLRQSLLERMVRHNALPGRVLTYQPDTPMRDPLGSDGCAKLPLPVARSSGRYKFDSQAQIESLSSDWSCLNGELVDADAEQLIKLSPPASHGPGPRDVTLELTTQRATKPIFLPVRSGIERPHFSIDSAAELFRELSQRDDVRLTLGGVGDPLLHPELFQIIAEARTAGIQAIHVESDMLPPDASLVERLAEAEIDILSVHIPALQPHTYASVMGRDCLGEVIQNIQRFISARSARGRGVPILQPMFVKTRLNLDEMEHWYDQWLRAVGSATIAGPSNFAGLIEDVSIGDMSPPLRVACRRIQSRITVLSDGATVPCEQDVAGGQPLGRVGAGSIREVWRDQFGRLRELHANRRWNDCELCARCSEWHRP